jgi:hypothetical protein
VPENKFIDNKFLQMFVHRCHFAHFVVFRTWFLLHGLQHEWRQSVLLVWNGLESANACLTEELLTFIAFDRINRNILTQETYELFDIFYFRDKVLSLQFALLDVLKSLF